MLKNNAQTHKLAHWRSSSTDMCFQVNSFLCKAQKKVSIVFSIDVESKLRWQGRSLKIIICTCLCVRLKVFSILYNHDTIQKHISC